MPLKRIEQITLLQIDPKTPNDIYGGQSLNVLNTWVTGAELQDTVSSVEYDNDTRVYGSIEKFVVRYTPLWYQVGQDIRSYFIQYKGQAYRISSIFTDSRKRFFVIDCTFVEPGQFA